jgi:hypothetical protein
MRDSESKNSVLGQTPQSTPLNIKQAEVEKRDGITIYDLSFSSPVSDRKPARCPLGVFRSSRSHPANVVFSSRRQICNSRSGASTVAIFSRANPSTRWRGAPLRSRSATISVSSRMETRSLGRLG